MNKDQEQKVMKGLRSFVTDFFNNRNDQKQLHFCVVMSNKYLKEFYKMMSEHQVSEYFCNQFIEVADDFCILHSKPIKPRIRIKL